MFHVIFKIFFMWYIFTVIAAKWFRIKNPAKSLWFSCLALMGLFICGISLFFLILCGDFGKVISYIGSFPMFILIIISLLVGEKRSR